jgi:hypothetical protein
MKDQHLLNAIPEYIQIGGLLKATPHEEAGDRFLYFEASNEDVDHEGEVILQKALSDSADYYLRHGNIDLSHFTLLGPKAGIADYMEYEIGKPVAVRVDGKSTFVKSQLYQGESPMAKKANMVWDSLVNQHPPSRWYPSVGGSVLSKSMQFDPVLETKVAVVDRVRWNNVALDRCPVNKTVPEVSSIPHGVFAKSMNGFVVKALTAEGAGTDMAALRGGAALGRQSLDSAIASYWPDGYVDFRERLAADVRAGHIAQPNANNLLAYSQAHYGLSAEDAAQWVARFLTDLNKKRMNR